MTPAPRILADAVVDVLKPGRKPFYRVTVKGLPPHGECRIYKFKAKSEDSAAFEGIRLFVEEMESDVRARASKPQTPA